MELAWVHGDQEGREEGKAVVLDHNGLNNVSQSFLQQKCSWGKGRCIL